VLRECEQVTGTLTRRDETYREWKHYESKVSEILETPERFQGDRDREKLKRNREKLANAKQTAEESRQICEDELRMFVERRTVHARVTLHALLRTYTRLIASICRHASTVAQAFEDEFQPGTSVEVVGLQEASDLNGITGIVEGIEEGTSHYSVVLPDGVRKGLPAENLIPLDAPPESSAAKSSKESPARVSVSPSAGPCAGCEVEVFVEGLSGPVQEVLIGGERTEILDASEGRIRVRAPPNSARGLQRLEVRTAGWRQYVVSMDSAFRYFESIGFGSHGHNVELSAAPGAPPNVAPATATRTAGLVQGVALTASPLPVLVPFGADASQCLTVASMVFPLRYYFEVEVLEMLEQRSSKTLALGFAWPLCAAEAASSQPASEAAPAWSAGGRVPESAAGLPRSVVVGGDLPKVHLGGKEIGKVVGWRPLLDVAAGTVLAALLEVDVSTFRVTVFQDSVRRFSTEAAFPEGWTGAPHGVVDVCGAVRCVRLRQGALPPEDAAEEGEAAPGGAELPGEEAGQREAA